MNGWRTRTIDEICTVFDGPHATPVKTATGPWFLSISSLVDGQLNLAESAHLSEMDFEKWTRRVTPREGDLLFSYETRLGAAALMPAGLRACLGRRMGLLRPKPEQVEPRFLLYNYLGPEFQTEIAARAVHGATVDRIPLAELPKWLMRLPPLHEQRAIAEVLGALDDKIALNERIIETTANLFRAMMQRLWKQGGVSSVITDQALNTPGWTRTTLGELCAKGGGSIQTGPFGSQLHASDYVETGIPSVMPQNIGENVIVEKEIARITNADASRLSKYLLTEGDVVYSRRGDVKRRALVRRHESGWLCGTGCLRVRAGNAVEPLFLSHYLGEPEVQNWIQQHAVGATMPNLNTSILGAVPVILPDGDVRSRINEEFTALDARSISAVGENKTLTALRDTLLPQLVTGKLRIKDAERVVEDVV